MGRRQEEIAWISTRYQVDITKISLRYPVDTSKGFDCSQALGSSVLKINWGSLRILRYFFIRDVICFFKKHNGELLSLLFVYQESQAVTLGQAEMIGSYFVSWEISSRTSHSFSFEISVVLISIPTFTLPASLTGSTFQLMRSMLSENSRFRVTAIRFWFST